MFSLLSCTCAAPFLFSALALAPDVVELKDGTRHAGEIRSRRKGVELATAIGVQRFAADDVARIEPRAEQLVTYRAALATAGRQPHALVTLSRWCLDHGLYPEAFDCVDKAAAAAPQDASVATALDQVVNEALLDGANPSEWPDVERRERLLDRIGGKSPSRAAFARSLLMKAPAEELVPWLVDELSDLDVGVRVGAAELLGETSSEKGLGKLIRASLVDGNDVVRDHARAAALKSDFPDLAIPYLRALKTDDERLRTRAYPALAELRDPRIVPGLLDVLAPRPAGAGGSSALPHAHIFIGEQRAYVRDFDVEIAQGAVIAKPVIGILQSGQLLDVAVAGVTVISYVERTQVFSTLRRVTGQDFGSDPAAWARWWSDQHGKLPDPKPAAAAPEKG